MTATRDIAAFVAAQDKLRTDFGQTVTLHTPQTAEWPTDTKINPDTNAPFDAMIKRTNPSFADSTIVALIVEKQASPMRPQAEARTTEIGQMSGLDIILDVANEDRAPSATEFTVNGLTYTIMEWKPFSIGTTVYRYLLYGQEK